MAKDLPMQSGFDTKPFDAQITTVNTAKEQVSVDSAAGPDQIFVPHPMLSTNSWIRGMPEKGSRLGIMASAGTLRRMGLCYYSRAAAEYLDNYNKGHGLYKPLEQGEFDLMSRGVSYIYGTAQGTLFLRGGVVHSELDPRKLRASTRAPTHHRELHLKTDSDVFDEERLGVVVRNTDKGKDRWVRAPGDTTAFAKEYLRIIGRGTKRLAACQEGDCIDATGKEIKAFTGKRTRAYQEYYDGSGNVIHQHEIDETGSFQLQGKASRVEFVEESANAHASVAQLNVETSRSVVMQAGTNFDIKANAKATIAGTNQTVLGPSPAPIDPVIKGLMFVNTVLMPFLALLQKHYEWMAKPPPDGPLPALSMLAQLKAQAAVISSQIQAIQALVVPTLSLNVFTS